MVLSAITKIKANRPTALRTKLLCSALAISALSAGIMMTPATASAQDGARPALVITNDPLPQNIRDQIYSRPSASREIQSIDVIDPAFSEPSDTVVGEKANELRADLFKLQSDVAALAGRLSSLENEGEDRAAEYYANVATISTQLQTGTTRGNPRLLKKITTAEGNLENLAINVSQLNQLATQIAETASISSFLLENIRSAFGLSGAVEEDHTRLAELEDTTNNAIVVIERLLNNVNDDITRASAYLSSERQNLRTLALAVANGDLYGKSLANRPFSSAPAFASAQGITDGTNTTAPVAAPVGEARPLVKIRFDRQDVEYEQPVYLAINEAVERFPEAQFELVAVHPSRGNAATVAIETTRARRNAEKVLRSLTQMGMPLERVALSYSESDDARTNEVHIYIR